MEEKTITLSVGEARTIAFILDARMEYLEERFKRYEKLYHSDNTKAGNYERLYNDAKRDYFTVKKFIYKAYE